MEKSDTKIVKSHTVRLRGEDSSLSLITVTKIKKRNLAEFGYVLTSNDQ